jgi:hypothetical protein
MRCGELRELRSTRDIGDDEMGVQDVYGTRVGYLTIGGIIDNCFVKAKSL